MSKSEGPGNRKAFVREILEQLYREHRQGLFTLALTVTRCPHRAEDAVQEAMARLCRAPAPPRDPVPYVYAAVRHAAIDQLRRGAARERAESASIYGGRAADPQADVIAAEQHARLRRAVDALPQPEREAVVMRVYGNLTFDQMAEALDEPLPTVASRYRRALHTLGRRMRPVVEPSHDQ